MTFLSYAQNFEDVMLWRALKNVDKGFYIDVGASDPELDSVTKAFYEHGWHGINIEPVSEWFEKLQKDRPDDINLQLAVGARKRDINFYEFSGTGLSTSNKLIAKQHAQEHGFEPKRIKVQVVRLTTICEQHPHSDIHFLKIDVEGAEKSVLQGFNLKKFRPWIILVESTLPGTQIDKHEGWEPILLAADYEYIKFDGLNRFYVAKEHKKIRNRLIPPPNIFDGFVLSGTGSSSFHVGIAQIRASLQETKQQRQQLEKQVQSLQAEAGQHDEKLREKETKQQELLLSMVEKETLLQEAATTLTDNKQAIDKLQTSLADSKAQQQAIEITLQKTKQQRQQLEKQVQSLQAEAGQHDEKLREKETKQQELLLSMVEKETLLQEAATTLTDNKQAIDKLQTSLADSKAQQQAIEITLQKTKQQRQQLEKQVQSLQAEAGQHDEKLREKETKQQELLLSMVEKETLLQEAATTLTDNKQAIDKLQTSLADSKAQQQAIEITLQKTKQQRQQLEKQVQSLQAEAGQHDEKLREKEESINWLNNEWKAAKDQIDELHQSNHHWWSMADKQSKELEKTRAKIDELNHSSHHWWLEAIAHEERVKALLSSKSWRIAWPLRKLMQLLRWLFYPPIQITLWLVRLPKCSARWLLVKAMAFALKRPALKTRAMARLHNYPLLDARLRRLAEASGLVVLQSDEPSIPNQAEPGSPIPESAVTRNEDITLASDLSHLTPNARRIYGELKTAIAQHEQESH